MKVKSNLELERSVSKNFTDYANVKIGNTNYILGEGENDRQVCKGMTDRITEQRAWGDVIEEITKIHKMRNEA